jgi:hypothetical protein
MPRGATFIRAGGAADASVGALNTLRDNGRTPIGPTAGLPPVQAITQEGKRLRRTTASQQPAAL